MQTGSPEPDSEGWSRLHSGRMPGAVRHSRCTRASRGFRCQWPKQTIDSRMRQALRRWRLSSRHCRRPVSNRLCQDSQPRAIAAVKGSWSRAAFRRHRIGPPRLHRSRYKADCGCGNDCYLDIGLRRDSTCYQGTELGER